MRIPKKSQSRFGMLAHASFVLAVWGHMGASGGVLGLEVSNLNPAVSLYVVRDRANDKGAHATGRRPLWSLWGLCVVVFRCVPPPKPNCYGSCE